MKVITAPRTYIRRPGDVFVFLAGGITNCPNWQDDVIKSISYQVTDPDDRLIIFNPRRPDFEKMDEVSITEQIEWEFEALEHCDILSMFFCNADSVQPICLYELGRNIPRMQMRFPKDWDDRLIITVEKDYSRLIDVRTQCYLAVGYDTIGIYSSYDNAIRMHASTIAFRYRDYEGK